jgi:hypothetical protein
VATVGVVAASWNSAVIARMLTGAWLKFFTAPLGL